jgi:ubiquinol-cytochrome c reductase cytochrome b subunit
LQSSSTLPETGKTSSETPKWGRHSERPGSLICRDPRVRGRPSGRGSDHEGAPYHGDFAPLHNQNMSAAYASTVALSVDVHAGLLIRQTHHWSALVFIGAIVVHLGRIFFTGAFRRPREVNWLVGVTMLTLALLNGFTGYSLPDDLLSGIGLRIAYSVVESIPLVGGWAAFLVFGDEFPAAQTIPRLYITHVLLVPAALIFLISIHLAVIVRQKHSDFPGPGRTEHNVVGSRFWPSYVVRTVALFAYVAAVVFGLGGLVQSNPVWIYGPYAITAATSPAQPDWFVAWEEGALRLFPPADFHIFGHLVPTMFVPGILLGAITFAALYAIPFVDARLHHDRDSHQLLSRPRDHPVRTALGVAVLAFYMVLTLAAADDIGARYLGVPVNSLVNVLRLMLVGLPLLSGAAALLLARALRHGGGTGFGSLSRKDLRAALRERSVSDGGSAAYPATQQGESDARVEIWHEYGTWRWRYVAGPPNRPDFTLTAGIAVLNEDDARADAAAAYPDVAVVDLEDARQAERRAAAEHPGLRRRAASGLVAVALRLLRRQSTPEDRK